MPIRIIIIISEAIDIDKSYVHAKGQCQPWKAKVTEVKSHQFWPQIERFRAITTFFIHIFTYGYEMLHKACCGIKEVSCTFSRQSVKCDKGQ